MSRILASIIVAMLLLVGNIADAGELKGGRPWQVANGDLVFGGRTGAMSARFLAFEQWDADSDNASDRNWPIDSVLEHAGELWWAETDPDLADEPGQTSDWVQLTGTVGGGAITVGTTDPSGGADGDFYVQVDGSDIVQSLWRNAGGTWAEYTLPVGGLGGLTETQVDARIAPYARISPTGEIALAQIPATIATDAEVAANTAHFVTENRAPTVDDYDNARVFSHLGIEPSVVERTLIPGHGAVVNFGGAPSANLLGIGIYESQDAAEAAFPNEADRNNRRFYNRGLHRWELWQSQGYWDGRQSVAAPHGVGGRTLWRGEFPTEDEAEAAVGLAGDIVSYPTSGTYALHVVDSITPAAASSYAYHLQPISSIAADPPTIVRVLPPAEFRDTSGRDAANIYGNGTATGNEGLGYLRAADDKTLIFRADNLGAGHIGWMSFDPGTSDGWRRGGGIHPVRRANTGFVGILESGAADERIVTIYAVNTSTLAFATNVTLFYRTEDRFNPGHDPFGGNFAAALLSNRTVGSTHTTFSRSLDAFDPGRRYEIQLRLSGQSNTLALNAGNHIEFIADEELIDRIAADARLEDEFVRAEKADRIRDADGGRFPTASAACALQLAYDSSGRRLEICANSPHRQSATDGDWGIIPSRTDLLVEESRAFVDSPDLNDFVFDAGAHHFYQWSVVFDSGTLRNDWVQTTATNALATSRSNLNYAVRFLGEQDDNDAATALVHTLAANTDYFYVHFDAIRRLDLSSYVAPDSLVDHWEWREIVGGDVSAKLDRDFSNPDTSSLRVGDIPHADGSGGLLWEGQHYLTPPVLAIPSDFVGDIIFLEHDEYALGAREDLSVTTAPTTDGNNVEWARAPATPVGTLVSGTPGPFVKLAGYFGDVTDARYDGYTATTREFFDDVTDVVLNGTEYPVAGHSIQYQDGGNWTLVLTSGIPHITTASITLNFKLSDDSYRFRTATLTNRAGFYRWDSASSSYGQLSGGTVSGNTAYHAIPRSGVGGTGNAIELTTGASLSSVPHGAMFFFESLSANTGSVTISVDGGAAYTVNRSDGSGGGEVLAGGEITADDPILVVYEQRFGNFHWIPGHVGRLAQENQVDTGLLADDAVTENKLAVEVRELIRGATSTGVVTYAIDDDVDTTTNRSLAQYSGNIYRALEDLVVYRFRFTIDRPSGSSSRYSGHAFAVNRNGEHDYRPVSGADLTGRPTRSVTNNGVFIEPRLSTDFPNVGSDPDELEARINNGLHIESGQYFALIVNVHDDQNNRPYLYSSENINPVQVAHIGNGDFPHESIDFNHPVRANPIRSGQSVADPGGSDWVISMQVDYAIAGGALLSAQEEGTQVYTGPTLLNCTGAGITCSADTTNDLLIINVPGGGGGTTIDLGNIDQDILPDSDNARSVGSASRTFNSGRFTNFVIDDTLHVGGDVASDLVPDADGSHDLGTAARTWGGVRAVTVYADQNLILDTQDMGDSYVSHVLSGATVTFTQADGTTEDLALPAVIDLGNITESILPDSDGAHGVGSESRTFNFGHFDEMNVDTTLNLGTQDMGDAYISHTLSGSTVTFSQADGTSEDLTLPAGGTTTDLENVGTNILPDADDSRMVGSAARTFANGRFTDLTVDDFLIVGGLSFENRIDLVQADNDLLINIYGGGGVEIRDADAGNTLFLMNSTGDVMARGGVRAILGDIVLGSQSLGDAYISHNLSGSTVTFTQADGSTEDLNLPSGGTTFDPGNIGEDVLPDADNSHRIGTSARTWNSVHATNVVIDNALTIGSDEIDEVIDDQVDSLIVGGDDIDVTYNDSAGTLTIDYTGTGGGGGGGSFSGALVDRTSDDAVNGNAAAVVWQVEEYDDGGWWTTGLGAGQFTVPAGVDRVIVTCHLQINSLGNGEQAIAEIRKGGVHVEGLGRASAIVASPNTTAYLTPTTGVLEVDAGDTFQCYKQSSDSSIGIDTDSWFAIYEITAGGGGGDADGVIETITADISGRTITVGATRSVGVDLSDTVTIPAATTAVFGLARQALTAEVFNGSLTNAYIATGDIDALRLATSQITGLPNPIGDITSISAGAGLTGSGCSSGTCTLTLTPNDADFPTIPITRGGTGATSLGTARSILGINNADIITQGTLDEDRIDPDIARDFEIDSYIASWAMENSPTGEAPIARGGTGGGDVDTAQANLELNDACVNISYSNPTLTCTQADGGQDSVSISTDNDGVVNVGNFNNGTLTLERSEGLVDVVITGLPTGAEFDLWEDVGTARAELRDIDRILIGSAYESGEPNRYVTATTLMHGLRDVISVEQNGIDAPGTDRFFLSDESDTTTPMRYITYRDLSLEIRADITLGNVPGLHLACITQADYDALSSPSQTLLYIIATTCN